MPAKLPQLFAWAAPVLIAGFGLTQLTSAQPAADPDRFVTIQGTVRNEVSGQPLRKAFVRLALAGKSSGYRSVTNERGEFTFQKIEPGSYDLVAECLGFIPSERVAAQAMRLQVSAGERVTGVRFALTPQATVSGRVVDDEGDPLLHGTVAVHRLTWANGRREIRLDEAGELDDRGEFRIANLRPGRYYLTAESNEGWDTQNRPDTGANMRLQRTWYPNAPDAGRATLLQIEPGSQVSGVEIRLRRSSVYRVRGKLLNIEAIPAAPSGAYSGFSISAQSEATDSKLTVQGTASSNGSFEIPNIPPGSYWITVRRGFPSMLLGEGKIEVRDENLDGVSISLQPPRPLRGVIKADSEAPIDLADLFIVLSNGWAGYNARPRGDNTFEIPLLGIDRYTVLAMNGTSQKPAYVKQVRYGDTLSKDRSFELANTDAELVVVVSSRGAQVTGTIRREDSSSNPRESAAPAPRVVMIAKSSSAEPRFSPLDQTGTFTFENLPPGAYRLFAFESAPDGVWEDPEFVKELASKAVDVDLKELEQKTTTVPLLGRADITPILRKLGIE